MIKPANTDGNAEPSRSKGNQQVAQSGRLLVAAELSKRGAQVVGSTRAWIKILLACSPDQSRVVQIRVKTKRAPGMWQTTIVGCMPMVAPVDPMDVVSFWVFVDSADPDTEPRYWVVPDWWMRDDIYRAHQRYLARHGGRRPGNPDSTHHGIEEERLAQWRDRWELLGIFG